jgi:hypothetical protein
VNSALAKKEETRPWQEAKHTLVAARLAQVLLIERDSKKHQTKHCKPSRLCSRFDLVLRAVDKYFPNQKAKSGMRNVASLLRQHKDNAEVRLLL